jgi:excinuclease ABC subunit B
VRKNILDLSTQLYDADPYSLPSAAENGDDLLSKDQIQKLIGEYTRQMQHAADEMEFEQAAEKRDKIALLKDMELELKPPSRALLLAPPKREEKQRIRKGPPARSRKKR